MSAYERNFVVTARDVDPQNRVRADAVAVMLQESAAHHADAWGMSIPSLNREGRTWVLARLAMEFGGRPGWKEELRVETWSRGFRGHVATRDYLVSAADGGVVARATSVWFVIDLATRRPVRLDEYGTRGAHDPDRTAGVDEPGKLAPPPQGAAETFLKVRASDLDLNGHVNNSRYIEWLYEAVPASVLQSRRMSRLELHFLAETHYPGDILIRRAAEPGAANGAANGAASAEELGFVHSILRPDGVEAVRARSRWS
ncbi:MAG: hypothetical protein JNG85_05110 [Spirochaetaceae bacterium]|nr:hypothetical protein [Spirochaetaceae bacterium]